MEGLPSSILSLIALDLPVYDLWKFCCINKRMHVACDNINFRIAYIRRHPHYFIPNDFIAAEEQHIISYNIYIKWIRAGLNPDSNWDPSAIDNVMMRDACSQGYIEVVQLLLADSSGRVLQGSKADNTYYSLRLAVIMGHTEIVRRLLTDPRIDPCCWCCPSIISALVNRRVDAIHVLLDDPRVIIWDQQYDVIISLAEQYGHIDTAEQLRKHRSNRV